VLVRFPFSDLTSTKLRPSVVLADVGRGDQLLCQVTSNPYSDPRAIELRDEHFSQGGLQRTSYVRPGKLFTANEELVLRQAGTLTKEFRRLVVEAIEAILRESLADDS
jgi:mRNA interferase MazF